MPKQGIGVFRWHGLTVTFNYYKGAPDNQSEDPTTVEDMTLEFDGHELPAAFVEWVMDQAYDDLREKAEASIE